MKKNCSLPILMKHFFILMLVGITSCTNEEIEKDVQTAGISEGGTRVLVERDPRYPLILSQKKSDEETKATTRAVLQLKDYLGYSYKQKTLPVGNAENVFYPVLDLDKIKRDYPSYVSEKGIGIASATSFSYSNFERYTENSKTSKKVKGGASLNLGLFSIGAKRSMEEIFTSSSVNEQNSVFGELNVIVKGSVFTLQTSSNIMNKMKLDYQHSTFIDDLYNTHPTEIITNYGGYALFSFVSGGAATALYQGKYVGNEAESGREKSMNTDITASYGFKVNGSTGNFSGEFGIGKNFAESSSSTGKIQNLKTSVRTIGGSLATTSFTVPKDINSINVDLTNWVASLNNTSTHKIIDIADEGLIPLTDIILEKNIIRHMEPCYKNTNFTVELLGEPCIEIIYIERTDSVFICPFLRTRFTDFTSFGIISEKNTGAQAILQQVANSYKVYTGLKVIVNNPDNFMVDYFRIGDWAMGNGLTFDKLRLYSDNKRGVKYLVNTETKYALSIHNDYLLDTYAIRDYVKNLSTVTLSDAQLLTYTIIAL